jgi:hypothetical protein
VPSAKVETDVCRCPVCVTAATSSAAYFARAFGTQRGFALTAEAIADALGFCRRHGAGLLTQTELAPAIAKVFQEVVTRISPMIAANHVRGDQFWQTFFGSRDVCPACAYEQRAVARHAGRLARNYAHSADATSMLEGVCVMHLRRIADELTPALRIPFLAHCLGTMDNAEKLLAASLRTSRASDEEMQERREAEWCQTFNFVAGSVPAPCDWHGGELSGELEGHRTFADIIAASDVCPVCLEIEHARRRWMRAVPDAARHQVEGWLLFPTCPEHIATISCLGDRHLTSALIASALRGVVEQVRHQARLLVRAAETQEELAAVRITRWGKRRRRKPQEPQLAAPRAGHCPACERIELAEARAVGKLLEAFTHEKHRDAYARGYGLCMKHFAQACLIAPRGVVRDTLSAHQQSRLADAALAFDEMAHVAAASGGDALQTPRYRLALHRLCGFAGRDASSLQAQSS